MVVKIVWGHVNSEHALEEGINDFIDKHLRHTDGTYFPHTVRLSVVPQWTMTFKSSDGDINQSVEDPRLIAVIQY